MAVHFTIQITKEVLERSKFCPSYADDLKNTGENCAIALALKDLFPEVCVSADHIHPFGLLEEDKASPRIKLPDSARHFIKVFDSLCKMPRVRVLLPAFDFDIIISDEIIARINIDEVRHFLQPQYAMGSLVQ